MCATPQMNLEDGTKISVIRSRQGLETLMKEWEDLQKAEARPVPGVDPHHYIYELDSLGQDTRPHIVCLRRAGKLEAMLIGRRHLITWPIRFGYLTLIRPKAVGIHIFHNGFLGQPRNGACSLLLRALRDCLNNGEADVAEFNHFHCDSVMYKVIRSETPFLGLGYSARIDRHWQMEIPESIDEFFAKKSARERQTLRRKIRKLEKSHDITIKTFSEEANIKEGISAAADVSSKTYQYALDGGFENNSHMLSYLSCVAARGWLRIYILYIDNEAAAFEWGIKYGQTFFLKTLGFDPKWRNWSAGTVLFLKVLEALSKEKSILQMDFGFGDAEYKKIYANTWTDTRSLFVFADRFYPRLLNVANLAIVEMWMAAAFVANKLGIERKLKRIWRDRLRSKMMTLGKGGFQTAPRDQDYTDMRNEMI